MRVAKCLYHGVLPVNSQGILRQVVCAYGEEVYFLRKLICNHYCSGRLNHNADFDFPYCDIFRYEFGFALL